MVANGEFNELIARMMEENEGLSRNGLHHTIVRYCCDVLGPIWKEALKNTKKGKEISKLQEAQNRKM